MKYYIFIILLFLNISCFKEDEFKKIEQGKKNWEFVECMNTNKVINNCKNIKNWNNKIECMSSSCGRPNSNWSTIEFR